MSVVNNVRIEKLDDNPMSWRSKVFINDAPIKKVKALDFHVAVDEVPSVVISTCGFPNIDGKYCVDFSFTPQTVEEAIKVLESSGYTVLKSE